MRAAVLIATVCFASAVQAAQNGVPANSEASGVSTVWDVRAYMASMAADVRRLEPILGKANPAEWIQKGAPDVYVRQLQSTQLALQGLIASTEKLAQEPEKAAIAIDTYFQMERMELLLGSLREGIRKYQDAELADTLNRVYAENMVHRDRLRQHIRDLTRTRDQEFDIANQEAQRCRGMILRETPAAPQRKPERRKKP